MKKCKCILVLALAICFLSLAAASVSGANDIVKNDIDVQQLINSIVESIPEEDFGGMYLNDSGRLVVNLKEGSDTITRTSLSREASAMIVVESVQYSLAELEAMKEFFEPYMLDYDIATLDANEVTNTVDIELFTENERIDELIHSSPIVDPEIVQVTVLDEDGYFAFTYADAPPVVYPEEFSSLNEYNLEASPLAVVTTIYPGTVIAFRNIATSYGTAGPRNTSSTFYSAGHLIDGFNLCPYVYDSSNSTKVGQAGSKVLGSQGDNCLVTVSGSGTLPSANQFSAGSGRYTISSSGTVGTSVEMWGGYSGISSGKITKTDQTVSVSGTTVGGLSAATYTCQHGDSGAGVFTSNAFSDTSAKCFGIQSIGYFSSGSTTSYISYFSPIN